LKPKGISKNRGRHAEFVEAEFATKGQAMHVPLKIQAAASSRPLAGKVSLIDGGWTAH
jgi:hypothetical protein